MLNRAIINKNRFLLLIMVILTGVSLSACAPKMVTKGDKFPLLYQDSPSSILILPPMNESTAAEAKDYYATTIQEPLSFRGYYVFPYEVTTDILKMEGIYDSELMKDIPLQKFREYFGVDAVLFTTIKKWNLSYMVIAANLTISIDCELKSTSSNAILWRYNGTVVVDLSGGNAGGGIAGLVAKAIVAAVSSAMADYVPHARTANYMALNTMPYGKYHALYGKDRQDQFIEQIQSQPNQ
ncbi:MAG: GNA1162 family protein [Syntrophales bacterium]